MSTRDRYGEPIDDEGVRTTHTLTSAEGVGSTDPLDHDPRCRAGWLPDDDAGQAVPCLVCRPHLIGRREQLTRLLAGGTR